MLTFRSNRTRTQTTSGHTKAKVRDSISHRAAPSSRQCPEVVRKSFGPCQFEPQENVRPPHTRRTFPDVGKHVWALCGTGEQRATTVKSGCVCVCWLYVVWYRRRSNVRKSSTHRTTSGRFPDIASLRSAKRPPRVRWVDVLRTPGGQNDLRSWRSVI